jgi:fused signal recognition particle receptor
MIVALLIAAVVALIVIFGLVTAASTRQREKTRRRDELAVPAPAPERPSPPAPQAPEAAAPPTELELDVEVAVDEILDERADEIDAELAAQALAGEAPPDYRERLGRSRGLFASLRGRLGRSGVDEGDLDDLEASLLSADVGVATTDHILDSVRARVAAKELDDVDGLLGAVRTELLAILESDRDGVAVDRSLAREAPAGRVPVWLFVGVNGVGKTTTIGKLATAETAAGRRVLLAAGDTFRAAAADQLATWAERSGAELVRGNEGGDPSAVVFDAIERAGARKVDLVLADTAGRLHTKVNLIEELKKVRRVADREPGAVLEVLLVLDATTGQNAVAQARQFSEAVGATGVVLTKLDGTARGGVVVAIGRELGLPVKLIGLGEGAGDLVAFDAERFVNALLDP